MRTLVYTLLNYFKNKHDTVDIDPFNGETKI